VLNIGKRDGVKNGQAVITGDGLVGRVAVVGNRSTRVLLITDLNSRIPVLVESTRTRAILAGNNADQPKLIHLPPNARVPQGDRIVTSGHAGVFPPGIPIGVVASVGDKGIAVQPFAERNSLEYIRVINYDQEGVLGGLEESEYQQLTVPGQAR
jgi:rod shape-determining protein MreC